MLKLEEERRVAVRRLRKGKEWLVRVELGEEKAEVGGEEGDDVAAVDVFEGLEEKKKDKPEEDTKEDKKDTELDADIDADVNAGADADNTKKANPDKKFEEKKEDEAKDETKTPPPPLPPKPTEPTYEEMNYKAILTSFYEKFAPKKVKEVDKTLAKKKTPEDLEKEFARLAKKYNCADPLVEAKSGLGEKVKKQKEDWQKEVEEWEAQVKKIKDEDKEREDEKKEEEDDQKEDDPKEVRMDKHKDSAASTNNRLATRFARCTILTH